MKTIETKQALYWHLADIYIQLFKALKGYNQNEDFRKMIDGLQNYINDKLELESNGDVIEAYVTVVQEVK